jgi:hypothetical protein
MNTYAKLVLSLASVLMISTVFAAHIASIYQASVPVEAQTPENKVKAEKQALEQVLIKVSGDSQVLDSPRVQSRIEKIEDIESLIQEFGYVTSSNTPGMPYMLQVSFDPSAINRILRNADVSVWSPNRPLVIAWVEYEAPDVPATIIDNDSASDIKGLIKKYADEKGLPVVLPMMDITDLNQVSVSDIVAMSIPTLEEAAKRYGSNNILIMRVIKDQNGYTLLSKLITKDDEWEWNISGKSADEVIAELLKNVGDTLVNRYAILMHKPVASSILKDHA